MATPADVARKILSKSKAIAHAVAHAPTGVTPGYHPALGATVGEDGRLSRVSTSVGETFYPALAHAEDVTTCVEDAFTRVGFTTLDYDPAGQLSFDDLQGTNWHYATPRPGEFPPLQYVQIGARVVLDTPNFGEDYQVDDDFGLWLYHYNENTSTATAIALLDYELIMVDTGLLGYNILLHGSAVVPMVQAGEEYYYIAVKNNSRFDRTITGNGPPHLTAFWAIPVVMPIPSERLLVTLQLDSYGTADDYSNSAWIVGSDPTTITALNADGGDPNGGDFDWYTITIPATGSYRLQVTGSVLADSGSGWLATDTLNVAVRVNGTVGGIIASVVTSDTAADSFLPISGSLPLSLSIGDVINPVWIWTNVIDGTSGGRGSDTLNDPAQEFVVFSLYQL